MSLASRWDEVVEEPGVLLRAARVLFWTYLFLLLTEGIFRKWIFPGQSNLFLIIRDPLVVALYAVAAADRRFPFGFGFFATFAMGMLAMTFSMFAPTTEMIVTLYGFKSSFLHMPLLFLLPEILDRREIERIATAIVAASPLVAGLMVLQFRSEPESFWNVGIGGSEGGQIEGALGRIRPPGPFSFATGAAQFAGLLSGVLVYQATRWGRMPWWLFGIGAGSLVLMCGVSVSRMLLTMVAAPIMTVVFLFPHRPDLFRRMWAPMVVAALAVLVVLNLDTWDDGVEAMNARLGHTGDFHTSFVEKVFSWVQRPIQDLVWAVEAAGDVPWIGQGLGSGTNVAAAALTGRLQIVLGEGEWVRSVAEMGVILGFPYMLFRLGIGVWLAVRGFVAARAGDGLALLLAVNAAQLVGFGQWRQATALGFAVVSAGLCLAASRRMGDTNALDAERERREAERPPPPSRLRRVPVPAPDPEAAPVAPAATRSGRFRPAAPRDEPPPVVPAPDPGPPRRFKVRERGAPGERGTHG